MQVTRTRMLLALGLVAVVAAVMGLAFNVGSPNKLPRCLDRGLIAIELAVSSTELKEIWNQPKDRQPGTTPEWRAKLKGNLYVDFAFMAVYGLSFVMLGLAARRRAVGMLRVMGSIAIATGIAAAGLDVVENVLTLQSVAALDGGGDASNSVVAATRVASLAKWGTIGVTLLMLFGAFRPSRRGEALYRVLAWISTLLVVWAGALGVWGWWDDKKIEYVIPCLAAGLIPFFFVVKEYWTVHMSAPVIDN